ncbi:MAG TPA: nuclear transport factor 2 family protein [Ktedonobacterales bacterium]|jgi:ketosteroid isomerase-like protein
MPQPDTDISRPPAPTRDAQARATLTAVERFNDAMNHHDVDAAMALMTDDCLFENTSPAPDGTPFRGQVAVRAYWAELFRSTPDAHFEAEEVFATGDRCTVRWRYSFNGTRHVRGVDVIRVRDGKIAEKLAYVKG